jgi:hypothetical protein
VSQELLISILASAMVLLDFQQQLLRQAHSGNDSPHANNSTPTDHQRFIWYALFDNCPSPNVSRDPSITIFPLHITPGAKVKVTNYTIVRNITVNICMEITANTNITGQVTKGLRMAPLRPKFRPYKPHWLLVLPKASPHPFPSYGQFFTYPTIGNG